MLTLLQNLTTTLENIIKLDEGDQKSFELALLSKNIMQMSSYLPFYYSQLLNQELIQLKQLEK